jgi:hypothetical protein
MKTTRGILFLVFPIAAIAAANGAMIPQTPEPAKNDEKVALEFLNTATPHFLPDDSELRKLLKQRVNAAVTECRQRIDEFERGRGTLSLLLDSCHRVLDARLTLADNVALEIKLRVQLIPLLESIEKVLKRRFDAGGLQKEWLLRTQYEYVDAIVQLGLLRDRLPGSRIDLPKVAIANPSVDSKVELPPFLNVALHSIGSSEPDVRRLLTLRANLAIAEMHLRWATFVDGRGSVEDLQDCARRLRDSEWDLATQAAARREILSRNVKIHEAVVDRLKDGCLDSGVGGELLYHIQNAKLELLRLALDRQLPSKIPTMIVALPPPDAAPDQLDDMDRNPPNEPSSPIPVFPKTKVYTISETEPELQKVCKKRFDQANHAMRERYVKFQAGRGSLDEFLLWSKRARNARLEVTGDPKQRIAILTEYRDFMKFVDELIEERYNVGAVKEMSREQTRYERLTAEIELLQAKAK